MKKRPRGIQTSDSAEQGNKKLPQVVWSSVMEALGVPATLADAVAGGTQPEMILHARLASIVEAKTGSRARGR